jgi:hypothetical protein
VHQRRSRTNRPSSASSLCWTASRGRCPRCSCPTGCGAVLLVPHAIAPQDASPPRTPSIHTRIPPDGGGLPCMRRACRSCAGAEVLITTPTEDFVDRVRSTGQLPEMYSDPPRAQVRFSATSCCGHRTYPGTQPVKATPARVGSVQHCGSAAKRCPRPSGRRGHRAAPQLALRVPP